MNKKITSLSLAGVMLLSTASPVLAATEEKEVKEPSKVEQLVKKGEEELSKSEEAKKEMPSEETLKALKSEIAKEKEVRESEAYKKAEDKVQSNYENAVAAAKSIVDDKDTSKEQVDNALKALNEACEKLGKKEEAKDVKIEVKDVKATTQKVKLDGKDVVIYGYNIDGYNYFKLRDLAAVLKDTKAKFGVEYKDDVVTLTKGADYKVAESDQKEVKADSKGSVTNDKVLVGDKELTATAYKVDDSNYYKLRDLGEALNFGVDFDKEANAVLLTSEKDTKEEKIAPKLEEVKESLKSEIAKEKEVRESDEYKKADVKVQTNYENAIAAAKSIVDDKEAKPEQVENALKALVEAKEKRGLKADAKVEEKTDKKEVKEDKKDEVKEDKDAKEAK